MTTAPSLVDRSALDLRRARAGTGDNFLHAWALEDVQDRLAGVNRSFTSTAIVTARPDLWQPVFDTALCVPDEDVLDLTPGTHDLVLHVMGLHWANDPVGQIIQCARALRPDGLCLVSLLGGQTLNELRAILSQAETDQTGGLSPRVAPMGDIRDLGSLLQRAGLALPVADSTSVTAEYRDLDHLMHDLRSMGETNVLTGRLRKPTRRAVFSHAAALYARHFGTHTGRIPATFELVTLTGWAPSDLHPKPLRPGSARGRLADALNTTETKLPD